MNRRREEVIRGKVKKTIECNRSVRNERDSDYG